MRWTVMVMAVTMGGLLATPMAHARSEQTDQVIGGVLNGLLGTSAQAPDQVYTAQQRDRLVSMLQGGEYVTSRQSEPIDAMVYGVPLTHVSHVYSARSIPPTQMTGQGTTQ